MVLVVDDIKEMINCMWQKLHEKFENASLDEYVIMPNHKHGIILLNEPGFNNEIQRPNKEINYKIFVGADPCVCPINVDNLQKKFNVVYHDKEKEGEHAGSPLRTIGYIVQ